MRSIGRDLSEEEVTPYHVMAYNIHIDPNDNTAVPPIQCPKRDSNMVSSLPKGKRKEPIMNDVSLSSLEIQGLLLNVTENFPKKNRSKAFFRPAFDWKFSLIYCLAQTFPGDFGPGPATR